MEQWPKHPQVYEINTRVWLRTLSRQLGEKLTLGTVPQEQWEKLRDLGMDLVWLMGFWQPSPAGAAVDRGNEALVRVCRDILPNFSLDDLVGSPYAVADYALNPALGNEADLVAVRDNLRRAGLGLILDFVPNHTAMDHPWVKAHPDWYVSAQETSFFGPGEAFPVTGAHGLAYAVAHGRDPYFLPWPDSAQLCAVCPKTRRALTEELLRISAWCDGLRCDMAMLALNRVFAQTWQAWLNQAGLSMPVTEFWSELLGPLKDRHPHFLLIAEAYWNLEQELLDLGFDYAYDKTGYDHLQGLNAPAFRQGLLEEGPRLGRMVRFLENHDEERLAAVFPARKAAAVIHALTPGLRLFHHGQLQGLEIRLPIQLGRKPEEPGDPDFADFYRSLLHLTRQPLFKEGAAYVLEVSPPQPGDKVHESLIGFAYRLGDQVGLTAVNYGYEEASGFFRFPEGFWQGWDRVVFTEALIEGGDAYLRELEQLQEQGLYVRLAPFGSHFFQAVREL
jgi:hypothetical protein